MQSAVNIPRINLQKGVKRIDTICKVCGARLRHTHRFQPFSTFQGVKTYWGNIGKGGYQRYRSVKELIRCSDSNNMARLYNQNIQRKIAEKDGVNLDEIMKDRTIHPES